MPSVREEFFERFDKGGVVAEVGVRGGENAARMLRILQPERLVLVDPWSAKLLETHKRALDLSMQLAADNPRINVFRLPSPRAAAFFPDEYFDLVYLDGDHSYMAVLRDIFGWYPKIKRGGWLTGHDYFDGASVGVKRAVDEFCEEHGLRVRLEMGLVPQGAHTAHRDFPNFAIEVRDRILDFSWRAGKIRAEEAARKAKRRAARRGTLKT